MDKPFCPRPMPARKASDAHAIFLSLTPCKRHMLRKLTPKP